MASKRIENLSLTLTQLATANASPKQMLRTTRKQHPKATKKEIIRAAFDALIEAADKDPQKAKTLQQFALSQRAGDLE